MDRRVLTGLLAAVGFVTTAAAAPDHTPPQRTFVGCLTQTATGTFRLENARLATMTSRTSGGSNAAKSSTPVNATAAADRPRTAGATTAKGSMPLRVASASSAVAPTPLTYLLEIAAAKAKPEVGHLVSLTGSLKTQRLFRVEVLRSIAASCDAPLAR